MLRTIGVLGAAGLSLLLAVAAAAADFNPGDYDANGNGTIERDEVVSAIRDYFAGNIARDDVVELIRLYFSGANVEGPVVDLKLDVGDHRIAGYWSDGTADVAGTITLTVVGGESVTEAQPVEVTCADDGGMRPELCHWQADLLRDGLAMATSDFRVRVPAGLSTLIFSYGGVGSTKETLRREVYAPERIVGVSREEWDCYVDRVLDSTSVNIFGVADRYGCSGWRDKDRVHKMDRSRPLILWATGDDRYIALLRESIDELAPMLNHDVKWTDDETQANFKAYVGIPREEWKDYGLVGITPDELEAGGLAYGTTTPAGRVIPQKIIVWQMEHEWARDVPTLAKGVIIHELLHAFTGVAHVNGRPASTNGKARLPKLSPMDRALFTLNSHHLVWPGMRLSQVKDLVVFDDELLDDSLPEPSALDMVWGAASTLVESGAVRFTLTGGYIDDCDKPFGTSNDPAILDIGNFEGFLHAGASAARYQDSTGTYWMGRAAADWEWGYWTERDGALERLSWDEFGGLVIWRIWVGRLQYILYALISHWDEEDVDVAHQGDTVTLEVDLDRSYSSLFWEPGLSLDFTMILDAETHEIEGYTWKRSHPLPVYCDTYEEVAQDIELGIDFTVPPAIAADFVGWEFDRPQLFETTASEIRHPEAH